MEGFILSKGFTAAALSAGFDKSIVAETREAARNNTLYEYCDGQPVLEIISEAFSPGNDAKEIIQQAITQLTNSLKSI
jgi:hypothetical protein